MKLDNGHNYQSVPTNVKDEYKIPETLPGFKVRHCQILIVFISVTIVIVARAHLGVTIVAMTNLSNNQSDYVNNTETNNTVIDGTKGNNDSSEFVDVKEILHFYEKYDWPKPIQEMVLSSFFLGYCIGMMPMGMISQRFGGKIPLQASLLINGVISLLTPWLAGWGGWRAICICRVIQGVSQAGMVPSMQTLLAQWTPLSERGTLSGYVFTGLTLGTIIAFQISGIISDTAWGWPITFYVVGILCLLCFVFLTVFGASSPLVHKSITQEEVNFIRGHTKTAADLKSKVPWKSIMTSKPVWADFSTHIGSGVAFIFLLTQVPSYIHYICGVDVKSSAYLSSLPYVFNLISSLSFGIISDFFTNRNYLSVKNARRIYNSLSQVGVAIGLIGTSFATNTTGAVSCICLSMGLYSGVQSGFMMNYMDIAPNFASVMSAIANTLCNVVVIIMPVIISHVVVDVTNVFQWRTMLAIVAGLSFFTNLVFVIFMSVEVQPWNNEEQPEDDMKKEVEELKVL